MKFSVITLFPEVIQMYSQTSIIGRAQNAGVISVGVFNPRDYTTDPHKKVDDSPYGGGPGMVLSCQPMDDCFQTLLPLAKTHRILLTSPAGKKLDQPMVKEFSTCEQLVILCGHYEGFDERIKNIIFEHTQTEVEEVSIGDYVLTGGELPALCILDAVTRMIPGAVQKQESVEQDSFYNGGLLDYPHYTRPAEYKTHRVPDILLSGDHAKIAQWRHRQALDKTRQLRPDLL